MDRISKANVGVLTYLYDNLDEKFANSNDKRNVAQRSKEQANAKQQEDRSKSNERLATLITRIVPPTRSSLLSQSNEFFAKNSAVDSDNTLINNLEIFKQRLARELELKEKEHALEIQKLKEALNEKLSGDALVAAVKQSFENNNNKELTDCKKQILDLQSENKKLAVENARTLELLKNPSNEIDKLKLRLTELINETKTLRTTISTQKEKIATIQEDNAVKTSTINSFKSHISVLKSENSNLRQEIIKITPDKFAMDNLNKTIKMHETTIANKQSENDSLETEIARLKADIEKNTKDLSETNSDTDDAISDLRTQIKDMINLNEIRNQKLQDCEELKKQLEESLKQNPQSCDIRNDNNLKLGYKLLSLFQEKKYELMIAQLKDENQKFKEKLEKFGIDNFNYMNKIDSTNKTQLEDINEFGDLYNEQSRIKMKFAIDYNESFKWTTQQDAVNYFNKIFKDNAVNPDGALDRLIKRFEQYSWKNGEINFKNIEEDYDEEIMTSASTTIKQNTNISDATIIRFRNLSVIIATFLKSLQKTQSLKNELQTMREENTQVLARNYSNTQMNIDNVKRVLSLEYENDKLKTEIEKLKKDIHSMEEYNNRQMDTDEVYIKQIIDQNDIIKQNENKIKENNQEIESLKLQINNLEMAKTIDENTTHIKLPEDAYNTNKQSAICVFANKVVKANLMNELGKCEENNRKLLEKIILTQTAYAELNKVNESLKAQISSQCPDADELARVQAELARVQEEFDQYKQNISLQPKVTKLTQTNRNRAKQLLSMFGGSANFTQKGGAQILFEYEYDDDDEIDINDINIFTNAEMNEFETKLTELKTRLNDCETQMSQNINQKGQTVICAFANKMINAQLINELDKCRAEILNLNNDLATLTQENATLNNTNGTLTQENAALKASATTTQTITNPVGTSAICAFANAAINKNLKTELEECLKTNILLKTIITEQNNKITAGINAQNIAHKGQSAICTFGNAVINANLMKELDKCKETIGNQLAQIIFLKTSVQHTHATIIKDKDTEIATHKATIAEKDTKLAENESAIKNLTNTNSSLTTSFEAQNELTKKLRNINKFVSPSVIVSK